MQTALPPAHAILHALGWFLSLHYSFWIPYQSAYCGCDSLFWFITPNRSAWDSCLIPLVIPALWGRKSVTKKEGGNTGILFPLWVLAPTLNSPYPRLPFSLCLRCFLSVSVSLSLSCRQKHTTPLPNIVKVSDGVIPMGQCVPHFPNLLPLLLS